MSDLVQEGLYKKIFDHAPVAIGLTNPESKFLLVNNAWCKQLHYTQEEAANLTLSDIILPEDYAENQNNFLELLNSKANHFQQLTKCISKDARSLRTNFIVSAIRDESEKVIAFLIIFQDIDVLVKREINLNDISLTMNIITEKLRNSSSEILKSDAELQSAFNKLEELARTDSLTGLPNRLRIEEFLHMESCRTARTKREFCICICDIDDFKLINDNCGHDIGDIVLKDIARIFRDCIRETDFVGRWGGEEFMLILPETNLEGAMFPMERIRVAIKEHVFQIEDKSFSVTVTMGFSCFSADSKLEDVIKQADLALYAGKKSRKNLVIQYTKQLETIHSVYVKTQWHQ